MDATIRCQMCGAPDLARATHCKRCGAALGAAGESGYDAGRAYAPPPLPPRPSVRASKTKACPVCFHPCAPSAASCPGCGHKFPGLRARYIVVPVSFLVILLLFAAIKFFDEKAKETRIRNLESGIAQQYGIVDTTVHPKPQKPWFWSFFRSRPTAAEVFAHNMEVSGGADVFAGVKSHRSSGVLSFSYVTKRGAYYPDYDTRPNLPSAVRVVMRAKAPNKIEFEYESGGRYGSARQVVRRGFDGSRGWEYVERYAPQTGPAKPAKQAELREFTGAELEQVKHYASATGLVSLADAYDSLVMLPNQSIIQPRYSDSSEFYRECYVVRGLNAEKKFETFYFDIDTGLLLRFDFEAHGPDGLTTLECYPEDYKQVDKLTLPFRLSFKAGDVWMMLAFEEYKLNESIPDSTFEPPTL
jgi:hypothetical protein